MPKPEPKAKKKSTGLRNRKPLQRRTPLRVGKDSLRRGKPPLARRKRTRQRYAIASAGAGWVAHKRKPLRVQSLSENAKERRRKDAEWRAIVHDMWVVCILTGATEGLHCHHAFPKQAYPDRRFDPANGLLLAAHIHNLIHSTPGGMAAGQRLADEVKAAADGNRPPVTRSEARSLLLQFCPRLRKYTVPDREA